MSIYIAGHWTELKLYYTIEFFSVIEASKLVTIEIESHCKTPDVD